MFPLSAPTDGFLYLSERQFTDLLQNVSKLGEDLPEHLFFEEGDEDGSLFRKLFATKKDTANRLVFKNRFGIKKKNRTIPNSQLLCK